MKLNKKKDLENLIDNNTRITASIYDNNIVSIGKKSDKPNAEHFYIHPEKLHRYCQIMGVGYELLLNLKD